MYKVLGQRTPFLNITDESNRFSITTPGHGTPKSDEKTINKLNIILEPRSQNDIELNVKKVEKRSMMVLKKFFFFDLGTFKKELFEELGNKKHNDLEDMVYRMDLTYNEIVDILEIN